MLKTSISDVRHLGLFQQFPALIVFQHLHLLDGNPIEFDEPLALWHTVVDEHGIDVLHIREADEFVNCGIVADVALKVWICVTPLLGSHTEHRHIKHIGFLGIDDAGLCGRHFVWHKIVLDGICMNVII